MAGWVSAIAILVDYVSSAASVTLPDPSADCASDNGTQADTAPIDRDGWQSGRKSGLKHHFEPRCDAAGRPISFRDLAETGFHAVRQHLRRGQKPSWCADLVRLSYRCEQILTYFDAQENSACDDRSRELDVSEGR